MNIEFYGKNMAVTASMKSYIEKKIGSLKKYLDSIIEARAEICSNEHHVSGAIFHCEVKIVSPHHVFLAEETAEDMYEAIDLVKEDLERQILKMKGKRDARKRKARKTRRTLKGL